MTTATVSLNPRITAETAPFWDAANDGKLMLKRCIESGKAFYPPRNFSPFTGSTKTEWFEASGNGTVYSYSLSKRGENPQGLAYIELDEGPIILSAITDCDLDAVEIGQKVRVVFVAAPEGQNIPMFTLDIG